MILKWLIPLLFVLSCGPTPKRNAEIITTYEGIVEVHHNPEFNTEQDLRSTLDDDKHPDFVIFSSPYCGACIDLKHRLNDLGWRDKVIILNFHEDWVNLIAKHVGITAVPSLIIDSDGGSTISPIYVGVGEIGRQLYEHLEAKK